MVFLCFSSQNPTYSTFKYPAMNSLSHCGFENAFRAEHAPYLSIRGGRIDPNIDSIDTNVGIGIGSILAW